MPWLMRHEVVDTFVYLGFMTNSSGGSRGEVVHRIGLARSCVKMLDSRIWKSSVRLEIKLRLYQTYIVPVLMYGCETWANTKYLLSRLDTFDTCNMQELEDTVYSPHVKCGSQRSHWFITWWLIDVCGSLAILLAVHLARTTIEPLQRVSDKYRPTGSDEQEDLATLGSVQLRHTLALWTLASRLPGERPLLETNVDNRHIVDTALLQQSMLWKKSSIVYQSSPALSAQRRTWTA